MINKVNTIKSFDFLYILTNLELYLELTKYLRNYVFFYAQKTKTLQRRKIILFKSSLSNKDKIRKLYSWRIIIDLLIETKLNSYCQV